MFLAIWLTLAGCSVIDDLSGDDTDVKAADTAGDQGTTSGATTDSSVTPAEDQSQDADQDEPGADPAEVDPSGPAALPESGQAWVAAVKLPPDTFPGAQVEVMADDGQACKGVRETVFVHPPVASAFETISSGHISGQGVSRYETEQEAIDAFAYQQSLPDLCNGQWLTDDPDDLTVVEFERLQAPSLAGAAATDAVAAYISEAETLVAYAVTAQVGPAVVGGTSTSLEVATAIAEALVARASGVLVDSTIQDIGEIEFLPGYATAAYWSWLPEGAQAIRENAAADPDGAVLTGWLDTRTDAEVDASAGAACAQMFGYYQDQTADFDEVVAGAYTAAELESADAFALGQAFGLSVGVYCPLFLDLLISAAEG